MICGSVVITEDTYKEREGEGELNDVHKRVIEIILQCVELSYSQ